MADAPSADSVRPPLAERIADYVATHNRYERLTKREVAVEAVNVLLTDIGAAQEFLQAIGVDIDLYSLQIDGSGSVSDG